MICWRRDRLPTPVFLGFPCGSPGKESACNMGDLGSILGLGRYPGEGKGYPLQYPGLRNSMGCVVQGIAKSQTRLSDLHSLYYKPINLKGNQTWILIGRTDAEAEFPVLWPLDAKSRLSGKDPEAGKDWRQKKKRVTEDKMVGWHHRLSGSKLGQTLGGGEGSLRISGKPGTLQSMVSQRVGHHVVNWTRRWYIS